MTYNSHEQDRLDPKAWTVTITEGGETFPFVEDEDGNITGLGHQSKSAFAAAVNRFELECGADEVPEDDQWADDHVVHARVTLDEDGETLHPIDQGLGESMPGAFAVTGLWGQR